ncbi:helix-turn-helix transcriptional regulator [Photobacterium sanguinicancri]|uniref:helix-turn-helix transcriptional regulator n=1 Tax=Photobacterium sanguinicancri TaxID=875932 RepID=UPI0026E3B4CA|nr:WYL domain-containing protein [Photobacterium sanguinicancri]MDO6497001.1 WYL domain-containing protein [Photobacterium sanguinicancri]
MAKRSSTQESVALAFELLKRIPRHRKVTASELRNQLESIGITRDIRTIQRNLETLCEHFNITRDERSKPYGYSWNKCGEGLAMPNLSSHEALLLSMAEDYLVNLLPSNVMASLDGFFSEARYKLNPHCDNSKDRNWLKKVRVVSETQPLLPPKLDSEVLKAVSGALYNDRLLNVEYHNARQQTRTALVMPLGLAQQGCRMYLVCRFDGYDNERALALHRITKAVVSSFSFERPKDFRLSQYDADGRFGFGEGDKCKIVFCITKPAGYHLLETPLAENQTVEEFDEHYSISATVIDSLRLKMWVRSFGDDIWNVSYGK